VRFCAEEYNHPSYENCRNGYKHLTNYSLNKNHQLFKIHGPQDDILAINDTNKRTFTSVLKGIYL